MVLENLRGTFEIDMVETVGIFGLSSTFFGSELYYGEETELARLERKHAEFGGVDVVVSVMASPSLLMIIAVYKDGELLLKFISGGGSCIGELWYDVCEPYLNDYLDGNYNFHPDIDIEYAS